MVRVAKDHSNQCGNSNNNHLGIVQEIAMYIYQAIITAIIDGDTVIADIDLGFRIWLKKVRIRLAGINAPSVKTDTGKVAKDKLAELIPVETVVRIEVRGIEGDKYGRTLAIIFKDNVNINEWLVTNGYAVKYKQRRRN